jgi:cell division protein FtsN
VARRAKQYKRKQQQAPGWVWMLFGLSLGLIVAVFVYVRGDETTVAGPRAPVASRANSEPAPVANEPTALTNTATEPAAEARFDFYEMLPQFEVVIPEYETDVRRDTAARPVEQPGRYVLQAGSFSALGDADRRQAELALLGVESAIQRVSIEDDVFHRVRVGPVQDLARLNEIRRRLRDARIETLLMKVPE